MIIDWKVFPLFSKNTFMFILKQLWNLQIYKFVLLFPKVQLSRQPGHNSQFARKSIFWNVKYIFFSLYFFLNALPTLMIFQPPSPLYSQKPPPQVCCQSSPKYCRHALVKPDSNLNVSYFLGFFALSLSEMVSWIKNKSTQLGEDAVL